MRLLIVDDTRVLREALACALGHEPSVLIVQTAANSRDALTYLKGDAAPQAVLLDMHMDGSMDLLATIARAAPATPVIALAVSDTDDDVIACAEAGVAGYLLRDDSLPDLLAVISSVAHGETRCSPRIAATLLRRVATLSSEGQRPAELVHLTARECEVLQLLDQGMSNKQIARRLSIELRTVKNHVHHILGKFQVHRRAEAAARYRAGRKTPAGYPRTADES
jgi:DNA-binding NarL/FixJ family response regulator